MTKATWLAAALLASSLGTAQAASVPRDVITLLKATSYLAPLSGVSLSPTQKTQIVAIEEAGWKALIPQIQTVGVTHEAIIGLLAQSTVDVQAIKAEEQKKAAALVAIETARITMAMQVQALLTAPQIAQEQATHKVQEADLAKFWAKVEAWLMSH